MKFETGLSDRWLTLKLKELEMKGTVIRDRKWYSLARSFDISPYELSVFMRFQAKRMACELAKMPYVNMIALFGGVA